MPGIFPSMDRHIYLAGPLITLRQVKSPPINGLSKKSVENAGLFSGRASGTAAKGRTAAFAQRALVPSRHCGPSENRSGGRYLPAKICLFDISQEIGHAPLEAPPPSSQHPSQT
jgi:hypothetical protein